MPLVRGHYLTLSPQWLRAGSPGANFSETVDRLHSKPADDLAIAATGIELAVVCPAEAGQLISNVTFVTGGTAAGTPTNGYAVIRDLAGNKITQTADFTTTARATNTAYTVALTTAYLMPASGLIRVGISFTATTVPTLRGVSLANAVLAGAVFSGATVLAQTHGSGVLGVAPATIAAPSTAFAVPYFALT